MTGGGHIHRLVEGLSTWAMRVCTTLVPLAVCAAVYHQFAQRADLLRILGPDVGQYGFVLFSVGTSTAFLVLLPATFVSPVGVLARRHWPRLVALWLSSTFLFFDLAVFASVGRHLSGIVQFAFVEGAVDVAGDLGLWMTSATRAAILGALFASGVHYGALWLERRLTGSLAQRRKVLRLFPVLLLVLISFSFARHITPRPWGEGLDQRVYGALPVDLRLTKLGTIAGRRGPERLLLARLTEVYQAHFSAIERAPESRRPAWGEPKATPDIVLILIESWRADAASAALTPRIAKWGATKALAFPRHEAGTHSSQAALFSLLYGRNNLTYHRTLDAKIRPRSFEWLRSLGYRTAYFSGQPREWIRLEEFLNPNTVDVWSHDDRGTWPEWDRGALGRMVDAMKSAEQPTFSLVFLMATHFEYQYPENYERHVPVAHSKLWETNVAAFDESDREPHFNRYRNALAFTDDVVMDAIEQLDDETLVIVTGDHGEAFYEGGLYGHGFSFSDAVRRVPLFAHFPALPGTPARYLGPGVVQGRTLHEDVLGWLMNYVFQGSVDLPGYQGQADFSLVDPSRSVLSSYGRPGGLLTEVQLNLSSPAPTIRLSLGLDRRTPDVRFFGFEDENARPHAGPLLDDVTVERITEAFDAELARAAR